MIRYPIAIEAGDADHAWGVVVPDLPGCFSAGDSMDEAIDNAYEAIEGWVEVALEDGAAVPPPSPIEVHRANPEFHGWLWGIAELDPAVLSTRAIRLNISLAESLVHRIDAYVAEHHMNRSAFLAMAAERAMRSD